ncbi:hypothetical protein B0T14DRAFT_503036 [Immersiella caudata]|uniref:Uncharacterized protein n=1 Tax=Immersiella caudata TaxID=314043 RepID=A0AA39XDL7_9PEZI|nr:hypothetical protein B0T14DRAFT_503036 [Immersiella caudata]
MVSRTRLTPSGVEADLEGHDVACTVTSTQLGITQSYRFVLFSQIDMADSCTATKIEHLYLSSRGREAAIVFLIDSDDTESATQAFMGLQTKLSNILPSCASQPNPTRSRSDSYQACFTYQLISSRMIETALPSLPIIPLTAPSSLATALNSFITSALRTATPPPWALDVNHGLLPHCGANKPLPPSTTNTLSTATLSLRSLLDEISTPQGQSQLDDVLYESEAASLVSFWTHEFALA